ncbi:MAG: polyprenyl synthetase family protein [Gracilibacteraceae bacterium]|jgi:geranylgeranyl diphosphate synthase type II|nr:polyprenyl synthetase family protein [Gracilibacteraceae bacterium]
MSFQAQYARYAALVNNALASLPWGDDLMSRAMTYSLFGGGKRIRPVLALAAAELTGGDPEALALPAGGLELIHTYSLIHDDLPCMDDDDTRRGRPANHIVFGEAAAVLAGDALLTLGLELVARPLPGVPPARSLAAVALVAGAAGWCGMVCGQMLDAAGETGGEAGERLAWLERMQSMKTSALLVASAELGAVLAGAGEAELVSLRAYAAALGAAFQIKDDILDVEGDSSVLGKPAGSDARSAKLTYPSLLGLERAGTVLRQKTEEAVNALAAWGEEAAFLRDLAVSAAGREK